MGYLLSPGKSNEQSAEETHMSHDNKGASVTQKSSESEQLLPQQIRSHSIEVPTGSAKTAPVISRYG